MDDLDEPLIAELRAALDRAIAGGMAEDPVAHAGQVAAVMTVLDQVFRADGLRCVLVGGAAIEVHAPGAYRSYDIDVVVDAWHVSNPRARIDRVFDRLGFTRDGRHRVRGALYVEVPGVELTDPVVQYRNGPWHFAVVPKEVVLRDRLVGFKHWGQVMYGLQAVDMLDTFGDLLDMDWLGPQLRREHVADAFTALAALAATGVLVTEPMLDRLLAQLRGWPTDDLLAGPDE